VEHTELWRKPATWFKVWVWLRMRSPYGAAAAQGFTIHWIDVHQAVRDLTPAAWAKFLRWARETGLLTMTRISGNNDFRVVLYDITPPSKRIPGTAPADLFDPAPVDPPAPAPAAKPTRETWLTPYGRVWESVMGAAWNKSSWKMVANYLGPLHKAHGQETVCKHLENYLRSTGAQYVTIARFAETFGKWTTRSAPAGAPRKATDTNDHADYK